MQDTVQVVVDKAISDRATSQPPAVVDSGKWVVNYSLSPWSD